jgi:hypothetical protein
MALYKVHVHRNEVHNTVTDTVLMTDKHAASDYVCYQKHDFLTYLLVSREHAWNEMQVISMRRKRFAYVMTAAIF